MKYGYEGFFVDFECDNAVKDAEAFKIKLVEKEATGDQTFGFDKATQEEVEGPEVRLLFQGSKKNLMSWLRKSLKEAMVGGPSVPGDDEIEEMIFEV